MISVCLQDSLAATLLDSPPLALNAADGMEPCQVSVWELDRVGLSGDSSYLVPEVLATLLDDSEVVPMLD